MRNEPSSLRNEQGFIIYVSLNVALVNHFGPFPILLVLFCLTEHLKNFRGAAE